MNPCETTFETHFSFALINVLIRNDSDVRERCQSERGKKDCLCECASECGREEREERGMNESRRGSGIEMKKKKSKLCHLRRSRTGTGWNDDDDDDDDDSLRVTINFSGRNVEGK